MNRQLLLFLSLTLLFYNLSLAQVVKTKTYSTPIKKRLYTNKIETFDKSEDYYGTLFHELVHSTGHGERLNRKELLESKGMRTDKYAIEELTAEMGASYLKAYAGIPIEQL